MIPVAQPKVLSKIEVLPKREFKVGKKFKETVEEKQKRKAAQQ